MSVAFFRLAKLTFLLRQVGGRRFLTGGKLRSLKTAEETCIWHLVKHGFMCLLTGTIPLWETKATSVDSSVKQGSYAFSTSKLILNLQNTSWLCTNTAVLSPKSNHVFMNRVIGHVRTCFHPHLHFFWQQVTVLDKLPNHFHLFNYSLFVAHAA